MITIRRATERDRTRIERFLLEAYGPGRGLATSGRWVWKFERNPFRPEDESPVIIAVEEDSGRVVGQICVMHVPLSVHGRRCVGEWATDFMVLPEFRGLLGIRLQRRRHRDSSFLMSLYMAEVSRRVQALVGSIELPPVPIFVRRLRYTREHGAQAIIERLPADAERWRAPVRRVARGLGADRGLATLANGLLVVRGPRPVPPDRAVTIESVGRFGAEFTRLWERVCGHFDVAVVRSAEYLEWKYRRQPVLAFDALAARGDGNLRGYVVLRTGRTADDRVGMIVELVTEPDDRSCARALVDAAVERFERSDVTRVETATGIEAFQQVLVERGFHRAGAAPAMVSARTVDPERLRRARWFLSRGDSDWDQHPPPR